MSFVHHPDGVIIINGVTFQLEHFISLEADYVGLPEGFISRVYIPDVKHSLSDGFTEIPLDLRWSQGDTYINNLETYQGLLST